MFILNKFSFPPPPLFVCLKTWISLERHHIWIEFYLFGHWTCSWTVSLLVRFYIHLLVNMCLWMSRLTVCSFSGSLGCDRPHFSIITFLWYHVLHILYCFTSMSFLYLAHSALICHCFIVHMKHFVLWHVDIDGHT